MTTLSRIQEWYAKQCNGVWEHSSGVSIASCDNPGWWVKINLSNTPLEDCRFKEISEGVDSQRFPEGERWLNCYVENGIWNGAGDETKLENILEVFLQWATDNGT